MGPKGLREQRRLLQFADGWAMMQGVIAAGFDSVEDGDATFAEHLEIDAEACVDDL